jgi:hypothetical protein
MEREWYDGEFRSGEAGREGGEKGIMWVRKADTE